MEIRQLEYVVKVAEEMNFSRAAKKLHIAQPSLSQQIAKLEKELEVVLFNRSTSTVKLTSAGEAFVEQAVQILDRVEQLKKEMSDVAQLKKGKLTMGSMSMTGAHLLPVAIPAFKKQYPGIEVHLVEDTTENLEKMTARGQLDISLLSLPLHDTSLQYETILEEEIMLAVPPEHPLQKKQSISLRDVKDETFIFSKQGQGFHDTCMHFCQEAGFEPDIVFESSNIETIQSLVSAGMGVALVPRMVVREESSGFSPVYVRLVDPVPTRTIVFAYQSGRYISRAATAFMSVMKHQITKLYKKEE
ncbi:MAG: LysR family transcriptional regulator [Bacillaceae bacterium]|nr:LysR family transcriptional regulator [Bacillaceae bacterium]